MSLLATAFADGMTDETEGAWMTNSSAQAFNFGDMVMVDSVNIHPTTLKRYKVIVPTAAGMLGTTAQEFGIVVEPNGIAIGAKGRVQFVSDEIVVNITAGVTVAVGDLMRPITATAQVTNAAGTAVGERFFGRFLEAATGGAAILPRKCRFNGRNPIAWRTV
jgi:hypothetical protein